MVISTAFKRSRDPRIVLRPSLALAICLALLGALVVPLVSAGAGRWTTELPDNNEVLGQCTSSNDGSLSQYPHNVTVMALSQLDSVKALFIHDGTVAEGSIYNTDWNGYSYFVDEVLIPAETGIQVVEMNITAITSNVLEPYALVIFSPYWGSRELSATEAEAVADYVFQGGNLLLLGEYGFMAGAGAHLNSMNKIGHHFGIQFRFVMVCDPTDHYEVSGNPDPDGSVDQPLISSLVAHEVTAGVSTFLLDWASCMYVSPPAVAIAYTDADSWLETNPVWHPELGLVGHWECHHDPLEEVGAFPVLSVAEYGEGRVVAVGDTSWPYNVWLHYYDTETLAYNVASWLLSGVYEHTVSTPDTPAGSSSGEVGELLGFSTGGSVCSQGHSVQYRFDWGDGGYSNWSSSTGASHGYSSTGTYQVRAQARCTSNTSVVSDWSSAKTVEIEEAPPPPEPHTVSTPNTPSGPSSGEVGESLPFSTGGARCNQGHSVQYRFDWGNGNYSNWSSSTSASYSYSTTGTYQVKAQARCASVTSITSGWSATKTVNIRETPFPENQRPDPPANLAQLDPSGSEIPVGDAVDINSVVFGAAVTDPDGDKVRLQVELRRLDEFGGSFDETKAGFKESNLVTSGTSTTCTSYGLIDGSYHWRARAVDEHELPSDWVQFGNNNISEADFTIASASVSAPILLMHGFQPKGGFSPQDLWETMARFLTGNQDGKIEEEFLGSGTVFWRLRPSGDNPVVYISNYTVELSTANDIRFFAARLADEIKHIRTIEHIDEIDIVAHSMGGLVARAYIESADFASYIGQPGFPDYDFSYEGDVRKLIMLGTPNHGALLAWLASLVGGGESARQMHPGSDFLNILNHGCPECGGDDKTSSSVQYVVFAGQECVSCTAYRTSPGGYATYISCLHDCIDTGKNWEGDDGVVSMKSAQLDDVERHPCIPMDHSALREQEDVCEAVNSVLLAQPVGDVIWNSDVIHIACPVHVTITDQYGRTINDTGTDEIPGVTMTKDDENELISFYLNPNLVYDVYIEAYENGKFTLVELLQTPNEGFMVNLFEDVPVVVGTEVYLTVIPSETVRLLEIDSDGDGTIDEEKEPVVIGEEEDALPDEGSAVVVGPNPVPAEGCVFWLDLPEGGTQAKLMIFSVSGRLVFETSLDVGSTRFPDAGTWNPVDQNRIPLANGPYVYVLIADGKVIGQGKMVIQR